MRKKKQRKRKVKKPPEVININGEISEEAYLKFCEKMSELEGKKGLKSARVVINTDGGSFYDGMAIASRIMSSRLRVTCEIYGRAFSAGSVIAVAGAETYMAPRAKIMVHELLTGVYGNTTQIYKLTLQLLQEQEEWCQFMSSRTGINANQWAKWLIQEKYFGAEEALKLGIIQGVLDEL